ncbi:hypothetical protein [Streptomyces melanogenes]|uniref:Uncharacterized protein n=1 Tax=Streptomyces melanogenes TaxID=67326 RepID=A0ABZ1XDF2_9ACTN|nr:hypothetical protein [Streptomyces melanogenes]
MTDDHRVFTVTKAAPHQSRDGREQQIIRRDSVWGVRGADRGQLGGAPGVRL